MPGGVPPPRSRISRVMPVLFEQFIDILDARAGTGRDAPFARAIDDCRGHSFLLCHRINDRAKPNRLTLIELRFERPRAARQARHLVHEARNTAHVIHLS